MRNCFALQMNRLPTADFSIRFHFICSRKFITVVPRIRVSFSNRIWVDCAQSQMWLMKFYENFQLTHDWNWNAFELQQISNRMVGLLCARVIAFIFIFSYYYQFVSNLFTQCHHIDGLDKWWQEAFAARKLRLSWMLLSMYIWTLYMADGTIAWIERE